MAGGIPVVYRSGSGNAIVNYDFLDVITGRGILNLYGGDFSVNSTKTYVLTPNQFYSQDGYSSVAINAGTLDYEFDLKLGRTLTTQGEVMVNAPFRISNPAGETISATILFRKVDVDGNVTHLISGACSQIAATASSQVNQLVFKMTMPKTTFKPDEILRCKISGAGAVVAKVIDWAHDPKNRGTINGEAIGYETSQFLVQLPIITDN